MTKRSAGKGTARAVKMGTASNTKKKEGSRRVSKKKVSASKVVLKKTISTSSNRQFAAILGTKPAHFAVVKSGASAIPSGYKDIGKLIVRETDIPPQKPVKATALEKGFKSAKGHIEKMIRELVSTFTEDYGIKEIELGLSFDADGKFMGFGVGGAVNLKVKIAPVQN